MSKQFCSIAMCKLASTVLFSLSLFSFLSLTGCSGGGGGGSKGPGTPSYDRKYITVTSISPTNNFASVDARNLEVVVTFSGQIDPTSFVNTSAAVGNAIAEKGFGAVEMLTNKTASLSGMKLSDLTSGKYLLTRQHGGQKVIATVDSYDFQWDGKGHSLNVRLAETGENIHFSSQQLKAAGVTQQTAFTVVDAVTFESIPGEVTVVGNTVKFRALSFLKWNGTLYRVIIKAGIKERNTTRILEKDFISLFTTKPIPEPVIENVFPIGINANPLKTITAKPNFVVTTSSLLDNVLLQKLSLNSEGVEVATSVAATSSFEVGTNQIVVKPDTDLDYLQKYRATVKGGQVGVTGTLGNDSVYLTNDYVWEFSTSEPAVVSAVAKIAGTGSSNVIQNNSSVDTPSFIELDFNFRPNKDTINATSLQLKSAGVDVPYSATVNGTVVEITPSQLLNYSTVYEVVVTPAVKSKERASVALPANHTYSFKTVNRKILTKSPMPDTLAAPLNEPIVLAFNFDLADGTWSDNNNFRVEKSLNSMGSWQAVSGSKVYTASNRNLTFTIEETLPFNTYIRVTVGPKLAAEDGATIFAAEQYTYKLLNQALQVSSTSPSNNATSVVVNRTIEVRFNYPLDATTVSSSSLSVRNCRGSMVSGRITHDTDRLYFLPDNSYVSFCQHTVEVNRSLLGVQNRQQETTHSFRFTTDGLKAQRTLVTMAYGNYVDIASDIEVEFNYDIACCVSTTMVTLRDEYNRTIGGSVYRSGNRLRFVPSRYLNYGTGYDFYVSSGSLGPKGVNGETLQNDYKVSFLTENLPVDVVDYGPVGDDVWVRDRFWVEVDPDLDTVGFPDVDADVKKTYGSWVSSSVSYDSFYDIVYVKPYSSLEYDTDYRVSFFFDYAYANSYDDFDFYWDITTEFAPLATASGGQSKPQITQNGPLVPHERNRGCRSNQSCVGSLKVKTAAQAKVALAAKKRAEINTVIDKHTGETLGAKALKAAAARDPNSPLKMRFRQK